MNQIHANKNSILIMLLVTTQLFSQQVQQSNSFFTLPKIAGIAGTAYLLGAKPEVRQWICDNPLTSAKIAGGIASVGIFSYVYSRMIKSGQPQIIEREIITSDDISATPTDSNTRTIFNNVDSDGAYNIDILTPQQNNWSLKKKCFATVLGSTLPFGLAYKFYGVGFLELVKNNKKFVASGLAASLGFAGLLRIGYSKWQDWQIKQYIAKAHGTDSYDLPVESAKTLTTLHNSHCYFAAAVDQNVLIKDLIEGNEFPFSMRFTSDGINLLATANSVYCVINAANAIRLFDVGGNLLGEQTVKNKIKKVLINPKYCSMAVVTIDNTISIVCLNNRVLSVPELLPLSHVQEVVWSADGNSLLIKTFKDQIVMYPYPGGSSEKTEINYNPGLLGEIRSVFSLAKKPEILFLHHRQNAKHKLVKIVDGKIEKELLLKHVLAVKESRDSNYLFIAAQDQLFWVDVETLAIQKSINYSGLTAEIYQDIELLGDTKIAIATKNGIAVWDVESNEFSQSEFEMPVNDICLAYVYDKGLYVNYKDQAGKLQLHLETKYCSNVISEPVASMQGYGSSDQVLPAPENE